MQPTPQHEETEGDRHINVNGSPIGDVRRQYSYSTLLVLVKGALQRANMSLELTWCRIEFSDLPVHQLRDGLSYKYLRRGSDLPTVQTRSNY